MVGPTFIEGGRSKDATIVDISRSPKRSGNGCFRGEVEIGPDRPGSAKPSPDRGQHSRGSTSHRFLLILGLRLGRLPTQPLGESDGTSGPLAKNVIISEYDIIMARGTELPRAGDGRGDSRDATRTCMTSAERGGKLPPRIHGQARTARLRSVASQKRRRRRTWRSVSFQSATKR